jgi:6-pyruvoyltetrahydropterin/6-carboxytetrahydropterin synthase
MTVFIEDSFDSAHFLPKVSRNHKCAAMHGHTYRIRIEISGQIDKESGWVIDYSDIKEKWVAVKSMLDHRTLNDVVMNPTCENLIIWVRDQLDLQGLSSIELRETVSCGAVWKKSS